MDKVTMPQVGSVEWVQDLGILPPAIAWEKGREAGLEEAAKACLNAFSPHTDFKGTRLYFERCAEHIRALKSKP